MQARPELPKILFVDDEPNVLEAIRRPLRGVFDVRTAAGGALGLVAIAEEGPFAVIVSDMKMPGMNGAAFLRLARDRAPDSVRLLLTGQTELDSAIDAVNEGAIFRFLRKPCPPSTLQAALASAVEHHRLITVEKELLERTLRGSVDALSETLALASPATFGASLRVRKLVEELVGELDLPSTWEIEIAATMAQLGAITLPDTLIEKRSKGESLSLSEQALVAQLPDLADKLLAKIPRLEGVREIIRLQHTHFAGSSLQLGPKGPRIPLGARVLKIATDFDALESAGSSVEQALSTMYARAGHYDPELLANFETAIARRVTAEIVELSVDELYSGMVFAADVVLASGLLLVERGLEATPSLLARLRNYRASLRSDRVIVRSPEDPDGAQ